MYCTGNPSRVWGIARSRISRARGFLRIPELTFTPHTGFWPFLPIAEIDLEVGRKNHSNRSSQPNYVVDSTFS